jgi:ferredoxin
MIVDIDLERCTGCGLCDPICPSDVIHMERIKDRVIPVIKYVSTVLPALTAKFSAPNSA